MANSVDPEQTAPIGAVCSGSTLFASILNLSENFRQLFAAVDYSRRHFQMHFFLGALRVNFSENNWSRTGVVDKPLALLIDIFQLPRTLGFVRCSTH